MKHSGDSCGPVPPAGSSGLTESASGEAASKAQAWALYVGLVGLVGLAGGLPSSAWAGPAPPCLPLSWVHLGPQLEAEGGVSADPVEAACLSPLRKPPGGYQGGLTCTCVTSRPYVGLTECLGSPALGRASLIPCHCVPITMQVMWGLTVSELRGTPHQPSSGTHWPGRGSLRRAHA